MKKKKAVALLMAAVMSVTAIPIEAFAMEADSQQVSEELVLSGAEEIPSEEVFSEETEDIFTDEGNLPLKKMWKRYLRKKQIRNKRKSLWRMDIQKSH